MGRASLEDLTKEETFQNLSIFAPGCQPRLHRFFDPNLRKNEQAGVGARSEESGELKIFQRLEEGRKRRSSARGVVIQPFLTDFHFKGIGSRYVTLSVSIRSQSVQDHNGALMGRKFGRWMRRRGRNATRFLLLPKVRSIKPSVSKSQSFRAEEDRREGRWEVF